jgi:hypothetical protein
MSYKTDLELLETRDKQTDIDETNYYMPESLGERGPKKPRGRVSGTSYSGAVEGEDAA